MSDDQTRTTAGEPTREEVVDNLAASMTRLRGAVDQLRGEVEINAQSEWVRAKPELRSILNDLESKVDTLSQRAKEALGDLGSKIDGDNDRENTQ
jgi:outer membrane murein-binding lipoprotein Lpp